MIKIFQQRCYFQENQFVHTLKDVLAEHEKTIFAIAETEKYAHVTYFFRGENESPVATETRVMIPSIVAKNYIDHPCNVCRYNY